MMSVAESVALCNLNYGGRIQSLRMKCPRCGEDQWTTYWGINPEYRSQYNPGEYVQRTCACCGHVGPEEPC